MTKKQRELLLKVKAKILEEPAQFVMETFFTDGVAFLADLRRKKIPNCGTAACIAGWTVSLALEKTPREAELIHPIAAYKAASLLGQGSHQLFRLEDWPDGFARRWFKTRSLRGRARVAADRIDHFIATDGRE